MERVGDGGNRDNEAGGDEPRDEPPGHRVDEKEPVLDFCRIGEGGMYSTSAAGSAVWRGLIEIAVADSGPGILDCERIRVTDRFYRGH
jgi:signal transduction histidine kinase